MIGSSISLAEWPYVKDQIFPQNRGTTYSENELNVTIVKNNNNTSVAYKTFCSCAENETIDVFWIYFHGNSESLIDITPNMQNLLKYMREKTQNKIKVKIIAIDYYEYGLSRGPCSEEGLHEAALVALQEVLNSIPLPRVQNRPSIVQPAPAIIAVGRSLGSVPATFVASNANSKANIDGLILISPMASAADVCIKETTVSSLVMNTVRSVFGNNLKAMKSVVCPTTIIHGTADQTIPFRNAEILHHALADNGTQSTLARLDKCNHNNVFEPQYFEALASNLLAATRVIIENKNPKGKKLEETNNKHD